MEEPTELFHRLLSETQWRDEEIVLFGKRVKQPRRIAFYGDRGVQYTYSGMLSEALPWTKALLEIKDRVEEHSGEQFNSVLLNLYRDGSDSMGYHKDNEPELGKDPVIASFSLGDSRKFNLKNDLTGELQSIELKHNDLLIMGADIQKYWRHSVPKTRQKKRPRINLTFRRVYQ